MGGGRPKSPERDKFIVIGEKSGGIPSVVACKHCVRYHRDFAGPPPEAIHGRIDRLRIRECTLYIQRGQQHVQPGDNFVIPRKCKQENANPNPCEASESSASSWTKPQLGALDCATARVQASLALPDTFVTNPELMAFFELISPGTSSKLMKPKKLGEFVELLAEEIFQESI